MENLSHSFLPRMNGLLPRSRKTFITLCILALLHQIAFAQNPFKFSYQGVARDGNGKLVGTATVSVRVSIHEDSPAGPVIYQQTNSPQTNATGVFNLIVGTNAFLNIEWGSKDYFIQTEIDPDGGADSFTDMGTTPLLSVPYSLISKQWVNNYPIVQKGTVGSGPSLSNVQAGANLIWYPKKGAFRAGALDMNGVAYWDHNGIGVNSFATGFNTKASGEGSIAMGKFSFASGLNSVAIGSNLFANSEDAVVIGRGAIADGKGATAIGYEVKSPGERSLAMGSDGAMAPGPHAVSIGAGTVARAFGSVALGSFNNKQDPIGLNPSFDPLSRLFQIGNGFSDESRSNAMTVLRNGNIGIGSNVLDPAYLMDIGNRIRLRYNGNETSGIWFSNKDNNPDKNMFIGRHDYYADCIGVYSQQYQKWGLLLYNSGNAVLYGDMHAEGDLYVMQTGIFYQDISLKGKIKQSSDRRLKTNIVPLSSSLAKLSDLSGYNYLWKDKAKDQTLQTGVIAQEVEALFPELVSTDKDGMKSVNYVGLIPHLIEAVKELNRKDEAVTRLEKEMEEMKKMIAGLKDVGGNPEYAARAGK